MVSFALALLADQACVTSISAAKTIWRNDHDYKLLKNRAAQSFA